jgi:hypothetical protein
MNNEGVNKFGSAMSGSSQGHPALLETAMLPALPEDIEPEVVAVDTVIKANENSPFRRESLPLSESPVKSLSKET